MCSKVIVTKKKLVQELQTLGFDVLPSAANFVFARVPGRDGGDIAAKLREHSIIVRHFRKPLRIAEFMRITVGTDEQCAGLVEALREILKPA
jgi:histidinol-phosphate aminotransferase